jgi:hypothetical protein
MLLSRLRNAQRQPAPVSEFFLVSQRPFDLMPLVGAAGQSLKRISGDRRSTEKAVVR